MIKSTGSPAFLDTEPWSAHPPEILATAMRRACSSGLLFLMTASGCTNDIRTDGSDLGFEVRDSAGIEIVWNDSIGELGEDTLRLMEDLRIGAVEGEDPFLFYQIRAIALDEVGNIYVGNGMTRTIRMFSSEGAFIREFGGEGEGPGEVRNIRELWVAGDSVFLVDQSRSGKTVVYTKEGEPVFSSRHLQPDRSRLTPHGFGPGGWAGFYYPPEEPFDVGPGEPYEYDFDLVRLFPEGDSVGGVLVDYPPMVLYGSRAIGGPDWVLFGPLARFGFDGGGDFLLSRGHPYQVDVFDPWGRQIRSVRRAYSKVTITEEMVEGIIEGAAAPYDTASLYPPGESRRMKERLTARVEEQATFPRLDTRPCLGKILVAQDGAFWVERIDWIPPVELERARYFGRRYRFDSHSTWDIFNAAGRFQGTVNLPSRFTPMAVEEREVVGVELDPLDVEYVVRFMVMPSQSD